MEEIWFDSLADLIQLRADQEIFQAISASADEFVAPGAFSMVVHERVVYDYVTLGHISPPPAIQDPSSLEAAVDRQGYLGWGGLPW